MAEAERRTVEFGWQHQRGRYYFLLSNKRWLSLKTSTTGMYIGDLYFNKLSKSIKEYFFLPEEYFK